MDCDYCDHGYYNSSATPSQVVDNTERSCSMFIYSTQVSISQTDNNSNYHYQVSNDHESTQENLQVIRGSGVVSSR